MIGHPPYRLPRWAQIFLRRAVLSGPAGENAVYLTFDDGPWPDITPWVLDTLDRYDARAIFFVTGDQLDKNPGLARDIVRRGHLLGNHTYRHLDAWKTPPALYLDDIRRTQVLIDRIQPGAPRLFRPPYGHYRPAVARRLTDYRIILWSVLSLDYDRRVRPEKSLQKLKRLIRPGDIVVFHDSPKAQSSLRILLPALLDDLHGRGFAFKQMF